MYRSAPLMDHGQKIIIKRPQMLKSRALMRMVCPRKNVIALAPGQVDEHFFKPMLQDATTSVTARNRPLTSKGNMPLAFQLF